MSRLPAFGNMYNLAQFETQALWGLPAGYLRGLMPLDLLAECLPGWLCQKMQCLINQYWPFAKAAFVGWVAIYYNK